MDKWHVNMTKADNPTIFPSLKININKCVVKSSSIPSGADGVGKVIWKRNMETHLSFYLYLLSVVNRRLSYRYHLLVKVFHHLICFTRTRDIPVNNTMDNTITANFGIILLFDLTCSCCAADYASIPLTGNIM